MRAEAFYRRLGVDFFSLRLAAVSLSFFWLNLQSIFSLPVSRCVPAANGSLEMLRACVGGDGLLAVVNARNTRQRRHESNAAGHVQLTGQLRRHATVRYTVTHCHTVAYYHTLSLSLMHVIKMT